MLVWTTIRTVWLLKAWDGLGLAGVEAFAGGTAAGGAGGAGAR
jgi:hypothetical protein